MATKRKTTTATAKPTVDEILNRPLPGDALTPLAHKRGMTAITPIYVTDRLNEAFGIGGWQFEPEIISDSDKMVIMRGTLTVTEHDVRIVQFGGNDNRDRGDAYKGAATDALVKCASYLGIGAHVWRNDAPREADEVKANGKANGKASGKKAAKKFDHVTKLEQMLEQHEDAANEYLASVEWIKEGQTFRDLDEVRAQEVLARPSDFLAALERGRVAA